MDQDTELEARRFKTETVVRRRPSLSLGNRTATS